MPSQRQTKNIEASGGIIEATTLLSQGERAPGSLISGQNIEGAIGRGYRRINGSEKYSSTALTGSGAVLGTFPFNSGVLACRDTNIEFGTGTTWTSVATGRTASKYRGARYNWVQESIILVNGSDYPIRYQADGSFLDMVGAPEGAKAVHPFKRHMCFLKGTSLFISVAGDETDFTTGATEINVGFEVNQLAVWRDALYVFGPNNIVKLEGSNSTDWALVPVTGRIGCIAPDTVQEVGSDIVFLAQDGLRTLSGTDKIGDIDLDTTTRAIETRINEVVEAVSTHEVSSLVIPSKSQFRIFWDTSLVSQEISKGLLGHLHTDVLQLPEIESEWEWFDLRGFKVACSDWDYDGVNEVIVYGGFDGYVYEFEQGNNIDGTAMTSTMVFPQWYYAETERRKVLHTLKAYIRQEGAATITMANSLDLGEAFVQPPSVVISDSLPTIGYYGSSTYGGGDEYSVGITNQAAEVNLIGSCFFHSISITSSGVNDAPYILDGFTIQYSLKGFQ